MGSIAESRFIARGDARRVFLMVPEVVAAMIRRLKGRKANARVVGNPTGGCQSDQVVGAHGGILHWEVIDGRGCRFGSGRGWLLRQGIGGSSGSWTTRGSGCQQSSQDSGRRGVDMRQGLLYGGIDSLNCYCEAAGRFLEFVVMVTA